MDKNEIETSELMKIVGQYMDEATDDYPCAYNDGVWSWDELKRRLGNMGRYKARIDMVLEMLRDQDITIFMENGETWNNIDRNRIMAILEGDFDES